MLWTTHASEFQRLDFKIERSADLWTFCLEANVPRTGFALLVDIDNFGSVNTHYGREFADRLLAALWDDIVAKLPDDDAFAIRRSGNGFLILTDTTLAELRKAVIAQMAPYRVNDDLMLFRSISCTALRHPQSIEDWLTVSMQADMALQKAKKRGGNMALLFQGNDRYDVIHHGEPSRPMYEPSRLS